MITKADIRERQGDKTLLEIALDVHMVNSGAMEAPEQTIHDYYNLIVDALSIWEPTLYPPSVRFDEAVREVLQAAVAEYENAMMERLKSIRRFNEHLERCSELVKTWPKWKREILGGVNRPCYAISPNDEEQPSA